MNFPGAGELHRTGRQAALQDGPVGYTLNWLQKRAGRRASLFCSPARPFPHHAGPPFWAARRPALLSSVQPAENSRFSFGNTALPALQLVLSYERGWSVHLCISTYLVELVFRSRIKPSSITLRLRVCSDIEPTPPHWYFWTCYLDFILWIDLKQTVLISGNISRGHFPLRWSRHGVH